MDPIMNASDPYSRAKSAEKFFYSALGERWGQLLSNSTPGTDQGENVPRLSTLAKNALLSSPILCPATKRPHSLIKKVLPNGFTILIEERFNPDTFNPEKPREYNPLASMQLVVKGGHLHENEKETGLAHLVEHGVFQGTENFTGPEILDFFKSLGCPIGADANACTSYKYTKYKLNNIPTKETDKFKKCIRLFYEFCTSVKFPIESMLKERDVVLNELLTRKGRTHENHRHFISTLFPDSGFVKCNHGNLSERIQEASGAELQEITKSFYSKWYRPENMCLIIVGDFSDEIFNTNNRNKLIEELETLFGQIPTPDLPLESLSSPSLLNMNKKLNVIAPWQNEFRTATFEHPNTTYETVQLFRRIRSKNNESYFNSKLKVIALSLLKDHLSHQLIALKQQPNNSIHSLSIDDLQENKFSDSYLRCTSVHAFPKGAQEALKSVIREIKRLEVYGGNEFQIKAFLNRSRIDLIKQIIKESTASFSVLTDTYSKIFIKNSKIMQTARYCLGKYFVFEQLKIENLKHELKMQAQALCNFTNQDLILRLECSPGIAEKNKVENLKGILENPTLYDELTAPQIYNSDATFLTDLKNSLKSTEPVKRAYLPAIEGHSWTFPNQIEVLYKPCDSLESFYFIQLIVPNDKFSYSREEILHMNLAFALLGRIGLKDKSNQDLKIPLLNAGINKCFGKLNSDSWTLTYEMNSEIGIETALQMIYLRLTDMTPILGKEFESCWQDELSNFKTTCEKWWKTEDGQLALAQKKLLGEDENLLKTISLEEMDSLSIDKAREILVRLLKQFHSTKLLICGTKAKLDVEPLVKQYIGALTGSLIEKPRVSFSYPFTPNIKMNVPAGEVPNLSKTSFYIPFTLPNDAKTSYFVALATDIINNILREKIRFENQSTYSLNFNTAEPNFESRYSFCDLNYSIISLRNESNKMDSLIEEVWNVLELLFKLPDDKLEFYLKNQKMDTRKKLASQMQNIRLQFTLLSQYLTKGVDPTVLILRKEWLEAMTIQDLKEAFHLLLDRKTDYKQLTMNPKQTND